jgi:filamentous hemagglutinin family protein
MNRFSLLLALVAGSGYVLAIAAIVEAQSILPGGDTGTMVVPGDPGQAQIQGGTQAGGNLFHQFQQFGLSAGQTATFQVNPSVGNIFSRVTGGQASLINGLLQVTGGNANLFLINPAGVIFGKDARLDLPGSFTATTAQALEFSGQNWLNVNGTNQYGNLTGNVTGYAWLNHAPNAVVNAGELAVKPGQQVMLSGGTVINTGTIAAPGGKVTIATVPGEKLIRVTQDNQVLSLDLPIATKTELATTPVNPTQLPQLLAGRAVGEATGLTIAPNGDVILRSGQNPIPLQANQAIVAGEITAPKIDVTGDRIDLQAANLKATQANGYGAIRVGGDFQGQGDLPKARQVKVDEASQLTADRGKIIVWSDDRTQFGGSATAPGGSVETSGKQTLNVSGARVKARDWLLDPSDVTIANGGPDALVGGTFDPAMPSTIAPGTIEAALDSGTNVTIATSGGMGGNGDITLLDSINQTGGGNAALTLTGRRFDRDPAALINLTSTGNLTVNLNQVAAAAIAPASSIQNAIDAIGTVPGIHQINLAPGIYSATTPIVIDKPIRINGGDRNTTFIDGNSTTQVMQVLNNGDLTLANTTIQNGTANFGGGIYTSGRLTVQNSAFLNNRATVDGGAIRTEVGAGNTTIDNSTFSNNSARFGGAIENSAGTSSLFTITDSTFINNNATDVGGAISNDTNGRMLITRSSLDRNSAPLGGAIGNADNSDLALIESGISDNIATRYGGGIATFSDSRLTIDRTSILRNRANGVDGVGGGIFADRATTMIILSGIEDNRATGDGGAIYQNDGVLSLDRPGFVRNISGRDGGAIANIAGQLNVFGTTFTNNQANALGGAIQNTGVATIVDSRFTTNQAGSALGGGAGAINNSVAAELDIRGTDFTGNQTTQSGGAIDSVNSKKIKIQTSLFKNNVAQFDGGAILADQPVLLELSQTDFLNNQAGGKGGGIYASGTTTIVGGILDGNRAQGSGGGFYNQGGVLNITDTQILRNQANNAGGGISDNRGTTQITGATIADNQARLGGGIEATGSRLTLDNVTVQNNRSVSSGGGIELTLVPQALIQDSRILGNRTTGTGYAGGLGSYESVVTIRDTLVSGNQSLGNGGGLEGNGSDLVLERVNLTSNIAVSGGGITNRSSPNRMANTTIANSQILANQATGKGGGLYFLGNTNTQIQGTTIAQNTAGIDGGGISGSAALAISNSTLTQNQAARYGGGINADGLVNLTNVTIANNTADVNGLGGGVFVQRSGVVRLNNTIVAHNQNSIAADVNGDFIDQGNNLIGISNGATGFTTSTLVGTSAAPIDPLLGVLANNGGVTQTLALLPGSQAIDAGNSRVTTDQRGIARVRAADIGAFESQDLLPLPPVPPLLIPPIPPKPPAPPVPPVVVAPAAVPVAPAPLVLPRLPVEVARSVATVAMVLDVPTTLATLDASFTQDYVQQFGASVVAQPVTAQQVQGLLSDLDAKRGIRSAVIYAMFVPESFSPQPEADSDALGAAIPSLLRATERRDSDRLELIFITTDGKLNRRSTNYRRSQVEEQSAYFWLANNDVENPATFQQFGQQMQQWLFAPIEKEIQAAKINGLMYVLDQGLRSLPIAAMQTSQESLLQNYTISVVPSLGMLDRQQTILRNQTTLAMGASEFKQLVPLPAVPSELAMIQQQGFPGQNLLNDRFTLSNAIAQQQQTRPGILHLATHADFNSGHPRNSFIQFWDQKLTLDQIDRLGLRDSNLELLILSACNTAAGDNAAELGFTGMASLFGVRTAMGSLWSVSDLGTFAFMSEFYGQLRQTPSRSDALRQTQLAMQQGQVRLVGGKLRTSNATFALPQTLPHAPDTTFTHPYYWSGFTMVGNPW